MERELPTPKELTKAFNVLGCSSGGGAFDISTLSESLSAFGVALAEQETQFLRTRCRATASGLDCSPKSDAEDANAVERIKSCLIARLATEVLMDKASPDDAWQGFAPKCCFACRMGSAPVAEYSFPPSPASSAAPSPCSPSRRAARLVSPVRTGLPEEESSVSPEQLKLSITTERTEFCTTSASVANVPGSNEEWAQERGCSGSFEEVISAVLAQASSPRRRRFLSNDDGAAVPSKHLVGLSSG